jgi:hypothetical protein
VLKKFKHDGDQSLPQYLPDILRGERFDETFFGSDERTGYAKLALLQGKYLFFNGIFGDEFVDEHVFGLPDAVRTVNGLLLYSRVPPWVKDENIIGFGKFKPTPPAFIDIRKTRVFHLPGIF